MPDQQVLKNKCNEPLKINNLIIRFTFRNNMSMIEFKYTIFNILCLTSWKYFEINILHQYLNIP